MLLLYFRTSVRTYYHWYYEEVDEHEYYRDTL